MNEKAQASLEFLMSYGWIIFVAMAAIAAFSFFGVLNPTSFVGQRCLLSPPLFCDDFSFNTLTGDIILRIRNGLQNDVNINEIQIDKEGCYSLIMRGTGEETIKADSTKDFMIDCDLLEGHSIKGDIEIRYAEYKAPLGLEKIAKGQIAGRV